MLPGVHFFSDIATILYEKAHDTFLLLVTHVRATIYHYFNSFLKICRKKKAYKSKNLWATLFSKFGSGNTGHHRWRHTSPADRRDAKRSKDLQKKRKPQSAERFEQDNQGNLMNITTSGETVKLLRNKSQLNKTKEQLENRRRNRMIQQWYLQAMFRRIAQHGSDRKCRSFNFESTNSNVKNKSTAEI